MSEKDDIKSLLNFVAEIAGDGFLKIEEDFGNGFVRLKLAEADRRQAQHDIRGVEDIAIELLRNSRDAGSNVIFFATSKEQSEVRHIAVIDDGEGIPRQLHEKVFEPRVTSRLNRVVEDAYGVHGRGMALYAIREASRHAAIRLSAPRKGCAAKVIVDLKELREKKDQSTIPRAKKRGGEIVLVGPHNLPRTVLEFALADPKIEIYYGSPAEILSTMYWLSRPLAEGRSVGEMMVNPDIKFWQCVGCLKDAPSLSKFAEDRFGLSVSERNAGRIIRREIEPLPTVLNLAGMGNKKGGTIPKLEGELPIANRIGKKDVESLAAAIANAFCDIGDKYYLMAESLDIKREKDALKITIKLADRGSI